MPVPPVSARGLGAGPGEVENWVDVAAGQPDNRAAVVREGRGEIDDHAGAHIVADMLAVGEELVVEDDLVAQRKGRIRVTDVVRLNQLERAEHHLKDERLRLDRARPGR